MNTQDTTTPDFTELLDAIKLQAHKPLILDVFHNLVRGHYGCEESVDRAKTKAVSYVASLLYNPLTNMGIVITGCDMLDC